MVKYAKLEHIPVSAEDMSASFYTDIR